MGKLTLIFIVLLLLATLGAVVFIKNPRPYKVAWASMVLDNKEHYMLCEDLPFFLLVEKTISQHQDILEQIKKIGGVADVRPVETKCYTFDGSNYYVKGDILVDYKNHQARLAVEKLIGDNFFGIPWRGHKQK